MNLESAAAWAIPVRPVVLPSRVAGEEVSSETHPGRGVGGFGWVVRVTTTTQVENGRSHTSEVGSCVRTPNRPRVDPDPGPKTL